MTVSRLIAALGNPGPQYRNHRHNVGFMVAEELLRRYSFGPLRKECKGILAIAELNDAQVALLMPQTFMNLSGDSVVRAVRAFALAPQQVLVIHDDVELPFGVVRLKQEGGLGGHNGLRSIAHALGSRDFWRIRVGVGRPSDPEADLASYVLSPFTEPDDEVSAAITAAADLVGEWLQVS